MLTSSTVQLDLVQRTFRKTDNHDTADKHKTTDGFPIENCIIGASEMRTFMAQVSKSSGE